MGGNIPESWAMDLSRSYDDLREEYALLRRRRRDGAAAADATDEDDDGPPTGQDDGEDYYYCADEDPKFVLFRHLLRELFAGGGGGVQAGGDCGDGDWEGDEDDWDGGIDNPAPRLGRFPDRKRDWPWRRRWSADESGYYQNGRVTQVPLMRFPCQVSGGAGPSVRDLVRREFRARSAAEERTASGGGAEDANVRPPSSYVDDAIRVQTAFCALAELNRKSAWAERMGFPAPSPPSRLDGLMTNGCSSTAAEEDVGPGREGSPPPAHGRRTNGGEGARRRRLRRGIDDYCARFSRFPSD